MQYPFFASCTSRDDLFPAVMDVIGVNIWKEGIKKREKAKKRISGQLRVREEIAE